MGEGYPITERKRAEEELRESETRFRAFVDHAGDALFVHDLEQGSLVDENRSACESLGYTRQELIGKTPRAFHLDSYQAQMGSVMERAAATVRPCSTHIGIGERMGQHSRSRSTPAWFPMAVVASCCRLRGTSVTACGPKNSVTNCGNLHVTNKYLQATSRSKRQAQDKLVDAILPAGLLPKATLVQ